MTRKTVVLAIALGLMAAFQPAHAQEATEQPSFQISISPILALAEWYTGEVEYAFGEQAAAVFGFSYFSPDLEYLAADLKLRFYPGGVPLEGFAISGIAGMTSVTEADTDEEVSGATIGVELGWSWLYGEQKRWYLGLGFGAKRFFGDESVGGEDINTFLPTARLNFGVAF